jgi:hypothetical protein
MTASRARLVAIVALALIVPPTIGAGQSYDDAAIVQFQRAADSYAFQHRQVERRGEAPGQLVEAAFFTPQAAAAFRDRLRRATCERPRAADGDFVVPRVNTTSDGTSPLPACLSAALPQLPPELEYRAAGAALLLADAHLHVVVDVLHAAWR